MIERLDREHGVVATALSELRTLLDAPEPGDPARPRDEFDATDPVALRNGAQR
ncbi:hypothetical protein [Nocardia asiatica]|uniref:hypothetical protein n=1 Tax=Nocardia asiatica TaxID=209252 RepID=UPI002458F225|nr:hypothetical protein [Nocardia asiatica]